MQRRWQLNFKHCRQRSLPNLKASCETYLLIYFKRCILFEYNTFDNETLAFFIILGALSHVTSFMVDERVITDNVKDFKPDDFGR